MVLYLSIAQFLLSSAIDLWMFLKITRIKLNINLKLGLTLVVITIGSIISIILDEYGGLLLANISEIIGFYLIYKKPDNKMLVAGAIVFVCTLDLFINIILAFAAVFIKVEGCMSMILLFVEAGIVKKYNKNIYSVLVGQNKKSFLYILCYVFLSSEIVLLVILLTKSYTAFYTVAMVLFALQIIFSIVAYHEIVSIQQELLNKQKQKEILDNQHQLEEYASYLEKSEDDLRAFRHDYKNILNSLKVSAQEGNVQEVIQKLDKYTETNLNSKALLKYKDVNRIYVKSIKSIIISKLTELYNLNIPYNFECRSNIHNLPDHVNELDLVRIIGITFDNAIEESKALVAEKHDIRSAEVQIMVYSDGPDEFEFEIRNKIQNKKISTSQIQQRGFTTKKDHKGLGLANIKEIESKYPDMSISYTIQDGWFDFYMIIDTEDGEEDE
ncbi:GHKL domain-containing protein [Lactobacillus amylovorus subsp. animalium]|uniref:GHKL domain-containing protein n=2 Tax=Lactobacillus amylovorus TaxID=1604 RepID=UPI0010ABCD3B|nr:GHKL domain-containing protein [Lactobacillus amylovorus]TJY03831.1 GHKL domain-containing protein [Lactobacillus amylovorus]